MLVGAAGAVVGLAGESGALDLRTLATWGPDLATGWVLIGGGIIALDRRPASSTGVLLAATGFAWFVPGFRTSDVAPIAWLAGHAWLLHRALLVQALLTYPTGHLERPADRVVVAFAYAAALAAAVLPPLPSLAVQAFLGAVVIAATAWGVARSIGPGRRARAWAAPAATATGVAFIAIALMRSGLPDHSRDQLELLGYEAVLCGVAVWLVVGLLREPWARPEVTDFVVELGDAPSGSVRDALARELGDPTLEVGFALSGSDGFVDAAGRPVALPAEGSGRAVTPITGGEQTVGIIIHDPAVLDDPALVGAVAEAARLMASNARLQAEVRAQIGEVEASRLRLVAAEDAERRRIARRLRDGAEGRLRRAAGALATVREELGDAADPTAVARVEQASGQLERTLDDLDVLSRGLAPVGLDRSDLHDAVAGLVAGAQLPIEVSGSTGELPPQVASAVYFVCSEAVANVVKHAHASRATITFRRTPGRLVVEIADDGVGGTDPGAGTGLRGLRDRAEGLSGRLTVESQPGIGTRLTAEMPVDGEA